MCSDNFVVALIKRFKVKEEFCGFIGMSAGFGGGHLLREPVGPRG
jgi:hypothetical protein